MADAPQDFEPPATPAASPPRIDENEGPQIIDEPMTPWIQELEEDEEINDDIPPQG